MMNFTKILTGAAGISMMAGLAAPASAQGVPYSGYNQGYNQGYNNNNNGGIGAVINSVLGGGRYGAYGQGNDRIAVDQCARAAEARASADFRRNRGGNYPQNYNAPRYPNQGNGYNNAVTARVVGITGVERRSNGLRVSGVIDSGMGYRGAYNNQGYPNQGYGNQGYGNQAYANGGQSADLSFTCRVNYRNQVTSVDVRRNVAQRRGY